MISIDVSSNLPELVAAFAEAPQRIGPAISRSLNSAAEATAVAISRELARGTGLRVRPTRQHVQVTQYATAEDPEAEIIIEGDEFAISEFSRQWVRRQDDISLSHAFHIPVAGPHHWFVRVGRERLPIEEITVAADLAERTHSADVLKIAEETARRVFNERMLHELDRLLALGSEHRTYGDGTPG